METDIEALCWIADQFRSEILAHKSCHVFKSDGAVCQPERYSASGLSVTVYQISYENRNILTSIRQQSCTPSLPSYLVPYRDPKKFWMQLTWLETAQLQCTECGWTRWPLVVVPAWGRVFYSLRVSYIRWFLASLGRVLNCWSLIVSIIIAGGKFRDFQVSRESTKTTSSLSSSINEWISEWGMPRHASNNWAEGEMFE